MTTCTLLKMAGDKTNVCAHALHVKILYFGLALMFVFSITCFVFTYVFFASLSAELGQKCSCPDGEILLDITVLPSSGSAGDSPRGPGQAGQARHGTVNKQVRAELGLRTANVAAADEPGTADLRGLNRVRRGFITQGDQDSSAPRATSFEAYARLPITISIDSIIAFCNETTSRCPAGARGPPGGQGEEGAVGAPGRPGENGQNCNCSTDDFAVLLEKTTELARTIGQPGPKGDTGESGPKGERGDLGTPGPQGRSGDAGPRGVKGDTGDRGLAGEPGLAGNTGAPGDRGPLGFNGQTGPQGQRGEPGEKGDVGETGPAGQIGFPGPRGLRGPTGDLGEVGPPGERGTSGNHGRHGKHGEKGDPGLKGGKGNSGFPGLNGLKGNRGDVGEAGRDGNNCSCTDSDGDTVTRVLIPTLAEEKQHLTGPPGPPGPEGPKGDIGDKGLQGLPGPNGTAGVNGQKGDMGEAGPIGPQGSRGRKGDSGPEGARGDTGREGPTGPEGTPGQRGEKGDPGEMGDTQPFRQPGVRGSLSQACNVTAFFEELMELDNRTLKLIQGSPGPRGSPGPSGPEGKQGELGQQGLKGDPGESGGVGLRGPIGQPGTKGTPGAKGLAGSFGYPGDPGEKGTTGSPGPRGATGDPGLPGQLGLDGRPGSQGDKGDRGSDGLPGPEGALGLPGADGAEGPAGLRGDKGDRGKLGPAGQPGEDGPRALKGEKGEKGDRGIASGMVELGNAGDNERLASGKATNGPTPTAKPKPRPSADVDSFPNTECVLKQIGFPEDHNFGNTYWGSWMQDAAPNPPYPDKIWVTKHLVGDVIYEYKNMAALLSGSYTQYHRLTDAWTGTGHVVYNNALYFHSGGSAEIIRYDLTSESVTARGTVPEALYQSFNGHRYLYDSDYTYLDLAVDDNGLWAIYKTAENHQNLVVSSLDPESLSVIKTVVSNHPQSSAGDAFVICGRLYTTKSSKNFHSTVDFAVNLFTGEVTPDVDIPYQNGHRKMTMMSYNPRKQLIYAWDKGHMVTYNVTLAEL